MSDLGDRPVQHAAPPITIIESIPNPLEIRDRLAQLMREQDLLRSLLRVAERKERQQPHQQGGDRAK